MLSLVIRQPRVVRRETAIFIFIGCPRRDLQLVLEVGALFRPVPLWLDRAVYRTLLGGNDGGRRLRRRRRPADRQHGVRALGAGRKRLFRGGDDHLRPSSGWASKWELNDVYVLGVGLRMGPSSSVTEVGTGRAAPDRSRQRGSRRADRGAGACPWDHQRPDDRIGHRRGPHRRPGRASSIPACSSASRRRCANLPAARPRPIGLLRRELRPARLLCRRAWRFRRIHGCGGQDRGREPARQDLSGSGPGRGRRGADVCLQGWRRSSPGRRLPCLPDAIPGLPLVVPAPRRPDRGGEPRPVRSAA